MPLLTFLRKKPLMQLRQNSAMAGWPGGRQVGLGFVLGAAMALGQAPFDAWYLTVPALAGLVSVVARQPGIRQSAWIGWFGGAGYFALSLSWIVEPFFIDFAQDGWMAPFAPVLMAFGLGLFWAAAGALAGWTRRPVLGMWVGLGIAELARGYVLTGFPWALIGHVWIDTPVAQLAAAVGPSGLTLLTLGIAAGLQHRRLVPMSLAVLAAVWAFGLWQLRLPDPAEPGVTVRLAQPNAAQGSKWDPDNARMFFDRLLAFSAAKPAVDLVIWPETALPYLLENSPGLAANIAAAAGVPVVVGLQRVDGPRVWNGLKVLGAGGVVMATYDKHHLVPFGEYLPFGDVLFEWLGISAFASQAGAGYSAGPGPKLLDLGPKLGRVLPLICYEAVFPQGLRGVGRAGWLLQITNDAWFGALTGPFQHAAQARLRAIEQGLPLVRVANTGITAVFDARGREVAALPFQTAAYLDARLPGALKPTLYATWGELPVLVVLAGLAAGLIRPGRRRSSLTPEEVRR